MIRTVDLLATWLINTMTEQQLPSNTVVEASIGSEVIAIGIPPRPAVLERIEHEMRQEEPNYSTLEKLISLDVGVSASLLKIANSAAFGFSGNIRSVHDALHVLGLKNVASAIAALSLKKVFGKVPNLERFWDSSASIAQVSAWLASQLKSTEYKIKPEEAYTFGLFRDCGIPLLMFNFSDYIDVLKLANSEDVMSFTELENEELGFNHAMMGAKLVEEWSLPDEFIMGVAYHHNSEAITGYLSLTPEVSRYFIALSQLAEYLFQRQTHLNKTSEWKKLGNACMQTLKLTPDDVENLVNAVAAEKIHLDRVS